MSVSGNYTAIVQVKVSDTELQKQLKTVGSKTTIDIKVNADTSQLNNLKTNINSATKEINNYSSSGQKVSKANESIATSADKASKSTNQLQGYLERTKKVFDFGLSTASLELLYEAIGQAKEQIVEFDNSLAELRKVTDLSGESLNNFKDDAFELAEQLSTTASNVMDATTEFAKSSFSLEDSKLMAKQALIFQTIADEQISASEAATTLIQVTKAYNMTAQDSEHIINALNEVSNKYAVSSSDLSGAIGKVASTANYAGVSFEELLGLITASNETMQNASKVANGYKTILSNLMTKDLEEQFNKFGLTMRNQNGEMKDAFTILSELAVEYNKIGTTVDIATGETVSLNDSMNKLLKDIGGAYNINILTSGFSNFQTAIDATNSAMNSAGSASEEYAVALDTVDKKSEALLGQFQQLVVGDGGLTQFVKIIIDAGTAILKFANSDIGQLIIKLGLLVTTAILANKAFQAFLSLKFVNIIRIATAIGGVGGALKAFVVTLGQATKAWITSPFGMITTAIGGVYLIVEAINSFNVTLEENQERLETLSQEYEEIKTNLQQTQEELDNVKNRINEINSLGGASITKKGELAELNRQKSELETLLEIEKERERIKKEELLSQAETTVYQGVLSPYVTEDAVVSGGGYTYNVEKQISADRVQQLKAISAEMINQQKVIDDLNAKKESGITLSKEEQEQLNTALVTYKDARDLGLEYSEALGKELETISGLDTELEEYIYSGLNPFADAIKETTAETDKNIDVQQQQQDQLSTFTENLQEQQDAISELASQLSEITSAYQTAVDALYEYNEQGYLSVNTYSELMQIAPEYLAMMIDETGQLYDNASGVNALYQARVREMGIKAASAQVDLASKLQAERKSYADLTSNINLTTSSLWDYVNATMAAQIADIKENNLEDYNALKNRINAINELTDSTIENAKYTTASIQPNKNLTTEINRNTEALKANKQALEDRKKALEEELDEYEIVIDYVKDLLKEEQEALEEQKDKELEAIQDKIDALEKEQDAMEESVDSQIEALEKQREEEEKYWDDQIDAIKDANDELEENIKLQQLQENLAKAKTQKVKVLKDGEFVYALDEEAISEAQKELSDYEMELSVQKQIEELEKLKEEALNSIDNQIEQLEDYREKQNDNYNKQLEDLKSYYDKVEAEYDIRIEQYSQWLEQFEDMLEASSKRHAEILYNELVGEQGSWDARIKALSDFVSNYEKKKLELEAVKMQIENIDNQIKSFESSASSSYSNINDILDKVATINDLIGTISEGAIKKADSLIIESVRLGALTGLSSVEMINRIKEAAGLANRYAQGTYSVPDNQIALVADPLNSKNREIVVGSKINKGDGILTSLKKGSGVIPAKQNLTENLVRLAKWANNFGGVQNSFTTNSNSNSNVINIENINLPEVKNGNDFVEYIRNNFMNDSIQFASIRR